MTVLICRPGWVLMNGKCPNKRLFKGKERRCSFIKHNASEKKVVLGRFCLVLRGMSDIIQKLHFADLFDCCWLCLSSCLYGEKFSPTESTLASINKKKGDPFTPTQELAIALVHASNCLALTGWAKVFMFMPTITSQLFVSLANGLTRFVRTIMYEKLAFPG